MTRILIIENNNANNRRIPILDVEKISEITRFSTIIAIEIKKNTNGSKFFSIFEVFFHDIDININK